MNVLFLEVGDVKNAQYVRDGSKNLLKTGFGAGDTIALCGKIEDITNTRYGPRIKIDDGQTIQITVGTFNENVRRDGEKILEEFKRSAGRAGEELYVIIYGNPYETDRLYINVNHDNGVILVGEETYREFHELRKQGRDYLLEKGKTKETQKKETQPKEEKPPETQKKETKPKETKPKKQKEIPNSDILRFIKENGKGDCVNVSDILGHFSKIPKEAMEEKLIELMEAGDLYEPRPGLLKVIE